MAIAAPITAMAASIGFARRKRARRADRRTASGVSQANLFQDRDLPVMTDYRALIGGVLGKSYGLRQSQLAEIFPQATPADLALV